MNVPGTFAYTELISSGFKKVNKMAKNTHCKIPQQPGCIQQNNQKSSQEKNKNADTQLHMLQSNALLVVYFLFAQSFARHGFFGTFPSIDTICNNQMSYRKADLIKRRPNLISQMHIHQSHFQNINWRVAMVKLSNKCSIPFLPIETRLQYFESF